MNQIDIANVVSELLSKYNIADKDLHVAAGSAMVLLGLRDTTEDVDTFVKKEVYDSIPQEDVVEIKVGERFSAKVVIVIGSKVELGYNPDYNFKEGPVPHGVRVSSLDNLFNHKCFLVNDASRSIEKRDQDTIDIIKLHAAIMSF